MGSGERLLLDRQAFLLEAGNGEESDCSGNLHRIPRASATAPAVWLDVRDFIGAVSPVEHVVLCLHGFDPSEPIDITVTAGAFSARTSAGTTVARPTSSYFLDSRTLFTDGAELPLVPEREAIGFLTTDPWRFMPPKPAREELARTGIMEIAAAQSLKRATYKQPFEPRTDPGMESLDGLSPSDVRIGVWGFKPGTDVPVGLYRLGAPPNGGSRADLVEQLGTVTTDQAWAAEYAVPPRLLHRLPPGKYCISFPVGEDAYCAAATYWYWYPGEARPGDTGDVVHGWQVLLGQAGELDNDSIFGDDDTYSPDVEAVIRRLQASWGWTPDGVAGPGTYARLTGLPKPSEPTPPPADHVG